MPYFSRLLDDEPELPLDDEDDELLEVTPKSLRLRKRYLDANERKRAAKK